MCGIATVVFHNVCCIATGEFMSSEIYYYCCIPIIYVVFQLLYSFHMYCIETVVFLSSELYYHCCIIVFSVLLQLLHSCYLNYISNVVLQLLYYCHLSSFVLKLLYSCYINYFTIVVFQLSVLYYNCYITVLWIILPLLNSRLEIYPRTPLGRPQSHQRPHGGQIWN